MFCNNYFYKVDNILKIIEYFDYVLVNDYVQERKVKNNGNLCEQQEVNRQVFYDQFICIVLVSFSDVYFF